MPVLQPTFGEHTISQLRLMFEAGQINLEPGFQRQSVWRRLDRRRLIQSVVAGYPVPSIFLYKRNDNGRLVYDVIDGKQRLETLFMFLRLGRFKKDAFDVQLELEDEKILLEWRDIEKNYIELKHQIEAYKIQAVEVEGDLASIIELFIRINSTGKSLTSQEKRNAKFYESPFLKEAEHLQREFRRYLLENKILSPGQLDRMKGTELFSELLMSIHKGGPINKKVALDRAIGNENINGNTLKRLAREFRRTVKLLRKMYPRLRETRFHNSAEFFSLFMLVFQMDKANFALRDKGRNEIAFELLSRLSTGVDTLRDQLRRARPASRTQQIYADYLLSIQGDTDSLASRTRREQVLRGVLFSVYETKDDKRVFTPEQRRILWNSEDKKVCSGCGKPLTWNDLSVDHVLAYAKGGKTQLSNAQLMHKPCNSSKGVRDAAKVRRRPYRVSVPRKRMARKKWPKLVG